MIIVTDWNLVIDIIPVTDRASVVDVILVIDISPRLSGVCASADGAGRGRGTEK